MDRSNQHPLNTGWRNAKSIGFCRFLKERHGFQNNWGQALQPYHSITSPCFKWRSTFRNNIQSSDHPLSIQGPKMKWWTEWPRRMGSTMSCMSTLQFVGHQSSGLLSPSFRAYWYWFPPSGKPLSSWQYRAMCKATSYPGNRGFTGWCRSRSLIHPERRLYSMTTGCEK